jgi:tetratricopeptide (TPR) repeat protein
MFFIRNNQIKAIELYEKSHKLNKNNKLYAKKFYETLGDSQIENELPEEAIDSYENALKNDKTNEELERKRQNAIHLSNGKKFFKSAPLSLLNVFIAPFAYWAAHSTINDSTTKNKLNSSSKKFFFTISAVLLIFVVLFFVFNDNFTLKNTKPNKPDKSNIFVQSKTMIKPISLENIAITKGDEIMNNISLNDIHLVDTAILAYKRALEFNSNSELAYTQLKKAETYQKEYFSKAQANILLDSTAYFVSMRRDSEGLRLFKYLFEANDKSQGKYGYVDSNMHIVIPPVYDFNYRKMYNGTENFNNGKAIICLIHSKGDTNYYKIDKFNHLKIKL